MRVFDLTFIINCYYSMSDSSANDVAFEISVDGRHSMTFLSNPSLLLIAGLISLVLAYCFKNNKIGKTLVNSKLKVSLHYRLAVKGFSLIFNYLFLGNQNPQSITFILSIALYHLSNILLVILLLQYIRFIIERVNLIKFAKKDNLLPILFDFAIMFYVVAFISQFIILFALHIIKDFNYFMETVDSFYLIFCASIFTSYSTKSYFLFSGSGLDYNSEKLNKKLRSRIVFVSLTTIVCQYFMGIILFLRGIDYLDIKGPLGLVEFEFVFAVLYIANVLIIGLKLPEVSRPSTSDLLENLMD